MSLLSKDNKKLVRVDFIFKSFFFAISLIFATLIPFPTYAQLSGYTLEDTILIPSDGSPVQSKIILTNEISYKIRASGEIPVGGPAMVGQSYGDTEYLFKHTEEGTHIPAYTNTPSITSECPGRTGPTDMGIGIDDQQYDYDKFPFWGPFENSHVYSIDFVGKGAPIILNYHDCLYGDNFGRLKIEIFKPLPPPPSDIWGNPLTTAIVVGVLGIVGTLIGTILQRKKSKSKSQSKARRN
jgi:hypothetical protein